MVSGMREGGAGGSGETSGSEAVQGRATGVSRSEGLLASWSGGSECCLYLVPTVSKLRRVN